MFLNACLTFFGYIHLNDVFILFENTSFQFQPNKQQFLFGYQNLPYNDPKNYLVLVTKKFIWNSKFKNGSLSIVGFKKYLKSVLRDLKVLFVLENKNNKFDVWNDLYEIL